MTDQFLKNYSIVIQEKVYEEKCSLGHISVYHTTPFGVMLTLNDQVILTESDSFILHEMMAHPPLFTHPKPKRVCIVGNHFGVLQEICKHTNLQQIDCLNSHTQLEGVINHYFKTSVKPVTDTRICEHADWPKFVKTCQKQKVDVLICTEKADDLGVILNLLGPDGIMVHPALPSLIHLNTLKKLFTHIKKHGFKDCQTLNFPQPSAAHGWRTIIMATQRAGFKRVREADVFNRTFNTRFYNFDMHKASLVLPEFMREELGQ